MLFNNIKKGFELFSSKKDLINNFSWALAGKSANLLSGLLVGIIVARFLGPSSYGLMNYVISYVTLFSIISNFGLDSIEIRELSIAKSDEEKKILIITSFYLRLLLSVLAFLLIFFTVLIIESDKYTITMVMAYSTTLFFTSFNVIRNYYTSTLSNKHIVKNEFVRLAIGAIIKGLLILNNCSLTWFILATILDYILIASGYLVAFKEYIKIKDLTKYNLNIAKQLIIYSYPLVISGAAIIIYERLDQIVIRKFLGDTELGLFSISSKLTEVMLFVPLILVQSYIPLLAKNYKEDIENYKYKRQYLINAIIWLSIFLALLLSISSHILVPILFGERYNGAISILQVLAWKSVFTSLFFVSGQIIIIENLQKYAFLRNICGCIVSVMLNFILIPKLGIIGSAWAAVLTFAVTGYFSHLLIRPYRFLFNMQSIGLFWGFKKIKNIIQ
ncbi:flippase [Pontibacter sp. H259]|uniref:flippase n=1 Tax=Pontibacter sp. H259 TaxID=3133421 RepID=UPI0030C1D9E1